MVAKRRLKADLLQGLYAPRNLVVNGIEPENTQGWTIYANNVPGELPDNFAGTPSGGVTFGLQNTNPVGQVQDFELSKDASNRQGEGVYYDIGKIGRANSDKLYNILHVYKTTGSFISNDVGVYLVGSSDGFVSDFRVIKPDIELLNASDGETFFGQIKTLLVENPSFQDLDYRVAFHIASSNTSSWTLQFNAVEVFKEFQGGIAVSSDGPIGEIIAGATETTPQNFLYCDGREVSRSAFSELFAAIGTNYGNGDGSTTFNVPDLRGEFLRGQDDGAGTDPDAASRTAKNSGQTGDNLGSFQGNEIVSHFHEVITPDPYVSGTPGIQTHGEPNGERRNNPSPPGRSTAATGGNETRPRNIYVRYYIRFKSGNKYSTKEFNLRRGRAKIYLGSNQTVDTSSPTLNLDSAGYQKGNISQDTVNYRLVADEAMFAFINAQCRYQDVTDGRQVATKIIQRDSSGTILNQIAFDFPNSSDNTNDPTGRVQTGIELNQGDTIELQSDTSAGTELVLSGEFNTFLEMFSEPDEKIIALENTPEYQSKINDQAIATSLADVWTDVPGMEIDVPSGEHLVGYDLSVIVQNTLGSAQTVTGTIGLFLNNNTTPLEGSLALVGGEKIPSNTDRFQNASRMIKLNESTESRLKVKVRCSDSSSSGVITVQDTAFTSVFTDPDVHNNVWSLKLVTGPNVASQNNGTDSSSGAGGLVWQNYIENNRAQNGTTGWERYANSTPDVRPDDFGGTPNSNVTFTTNTTDPLIKPQDFLLTKDAANRQGEGVYYQVNSIEDGHTAKIFELYSRYLTSDLYENGDVRFYIIASNDNFASDFQTLEPVPTELFDSSYAEFRSQVQSLLEKSGGSIVPIQYRFCIHIASTNADGWTIQFDDFQFGPSVKNTFGASDGPWIDISGDVGRPANMSVSDTYAIYQRNGKNINYFAVFEAASFTSGAFTFNNTSTSINLFPSYLEEDTNILKTTGGINQYQVGTWQYIYSGRSAGSNTYGGHIFYQPSSRVFVLTVSETGLNDQVGTNSPYSGDASSGDRLLVKIENFPIKSFRSSSPIAEFNPNQLIYARAISDPLASDPSISSGVTFTIPFDRFLVNSLVEIDTTNNEFIFNRDAVLFAFCKMSLGANDFQGSDASLTVRVDGSSQQLGRYSRNTGEAKTFVGGDIIEVKKDSRVNFEFTHNDASGVTYDQGAGTCQFWEVGRAGGSQFAASEVVAVRAFTTSGQSFASTVETQVIFDQITYDTHNILDTSTGDLIIKLAGKYSVGSILRLASVTPGSSFFLNVYVNGIQQIFKSRSIDNTAPSIDIYDQLNLFKNDVVEIRFQQNQGGSRSLDVNPSSNMVFLHRIGGIE